MKCLQCEGEWLPPTNVSISLDNCPFCGIPILNIEKAKSYTSLSNFLQYIVSLYGPEIYNNKQNLNGIIADLYTGEKDLSEFIIVLLWIATYLNMFLNYPRRI